MYKCYNDQINISDMMKSEGKDHSENDLKAYEGCKTSNVFEWDSNIMNERYL